MVYHVQFPGLGLDLTVNRVALAIGGFNIYWYGVIIAAGMLLAMLYAFRNAVDYGIDSDRLVDVVAIGTVIVAAMLMVIGLRSAKGRKLTVTLAVKDIKKQAEAGDRFAPDTLPANAPHAEFVKATDAMNERLAALDLNEVEIEEIEEPKE